MENEKPKSKTKGCLKLFGIFFLICVVLNIITALLGGNSSSESKESKTEPTFLVFDNEYYSKWRDDINDDFFKIVKTLNLNNVSGCGEFYYAEANDGEFVVACTRDGSYFEYYIVYPRIEKVSYATNNREILAGIKPPKGSADRAEEKVK